MWYEKKVKKQVVSNIFEYNQSGGGLLWALDKLLGSQVDNSTFFKVIYNIFNTIIVLIDVLLDVSISFPRFGYLRLPC